MKRPTPDEMRVAALWLEVNEGEGTEAQACARVAAWLEAQADAIELRAVSRTCRVPVASLRKRLAHG